MGKKAENVEKSNIPEINEALVIRKSNEFVTAKYKTTLLGNKIVALSLTKLEEKNGQLQAVLQPKEIISILGNDDDSNIYKKLKNVAERLTGHQIFLEDGNGNFNIFSMVTNVTYLDSVLTIRFNSDLNSSISQLRGQYTTYELATLTSFERNSTYRLYEILKKDAWRINQSPDGMWTREYEINELKCMIGLVNTDQPYIAEAVRKKIPWDQIVEEICKKEDKQFDNYSDFKKRVLIPAQKEMEEKAEIRYEFETRRSGRGGKVRSIIFHIFRNTLSKDTEANIVSTVERIEQTVPEYAQESRNNIFEEEMNVYQELRQYLSERDVDITPFTEQKFYAIYHAANDNVGVIKDEIDYSMTVPNISNYYGWLLCAVRERYSHSKGVKTSYGSSKRAEVVQEVIDSEINENALKAVWEGYKAMPEFEEFLETFEYPDVEVIEMLFPIPQLMKMYISFKKQYGKKDNDGEE